MNRPIPDPGKSPTFPTTVRTAMVLAAGFGKRLEHLTAEVPKPLMPIGDTTLLDLTIRKLQGAGISRIVVNLHYQRHKIREYLETRNYPGLHIFFSEEEQIMGTGGGIALAEPFFEGETLLVVNSDMLCDIHLTDFLATFQNQPALAYMAVTPSRNNHDYRLVLYDDNFRIAGFLPKDRSIPRHLKTAIFMGYQILTPAARRYLKPRPSSIISDFYQAALANGSEIRAFVHTGQWIDVGTKDEYLKIREQVQRRELIPEEFL